MNAGTFTTASSQRRMLFQATGGAVPLGLLVASATLIASASVPGFGMSVPASNLVERTTSAPSFIARERDIAPFSATAALGEVRRRTSLTWEQIALVLNVSRRTVHSWAAGAAIKPVYQEALQALADRVRQFRDEKTFQVRRVILQEYGLLTPAGGNVATSDAPAIMLADTGDTSSPVVVKSASEAKTRVHRR